MQRDWWGANLETSTKAAPYLPVLLHPGRHRLSAVSIAGGRIALQCQLFFNFIAKIAKWILAHNCQTPFKSMELNSVLKTKKYIA
ncbi:MAG: hypothetical protein ACT6FD_05605 [Methanosarcinaceae archaeon]